MPNKLTQEIYEIMDNWTSAGLNYAQWDPGYKDSCGRVPQMAAISKAISQTYNLRYKTILRHYANYGRVCDGSTAGARLLLALFLAEMSDHELVGFYNAI
jgi:hypothetical protein